MLERFYIETQPHASFLHEHAVLVLNLFLELLSFFSADDLATHELALLVHTHLELHSAKRQL